MAEATFKSPYDGSIMTFSLRSKSNEETSFGVSVKKLSFFGTAEASTFVSGSPATFFREMANNWQGWQGEKKWNDLEGCISFSATCDSTGHISIEVELVGQDYETRLKTVLQFEAGQLDRMANEITALIPY